MLRLRPIGNTGKNMELSGPKLGRPSKQADKRQRRQELHDEKIRNAIEGKLRVCKNKLCF